MIDFSTFMDGATLILVGRAVWLLSELNCKIRSLEARVKKLELGKFGFK